MNDKKLPPFKNPQIWTSVAAAFMLMAAALLFYGKLSKPKNEANQDNKSEVKKDNWAQQVEEESHSPHSKVKYNEMEAPPPMNGNHVEENEELKKIDIEAMTQEEFVTYAEDALKVMPRKSDLKNLKASEVHHFPEPVRLAGIKLGMIKEILTKRSDLEEAGINFYEKCAGDDGAMTSVRALCLTNLAQYKAQKGETIDLSKYPERVLELANDALAP